MKASAKLAVLSVAALGALAVAAPANAETVVPCGGGKGAETVSGSLSIAAGETCVLDGTAVTGNVYAGNGSSVFLLGSTVSGNIRVGAGAYLDATGGGINGTVTAQTAVGVRLAGVHVGGSVKSYSSSATNTGFVFTDGATIDGALDVVAPGEVLLERSNVGASVRGIGSQYTHLFMSTVGGNVTVKDNPGGAVACGSMIDGDGTFSGNSGTVQLGAGSVFNCSATNNWGDDLVVSYNTANLTVTNNVVVDDLGGVCNAPAPTGSNNQVGGTKSGQFRNL
jgi:hypothetical protein